MNWLEHAEQEKMTASPTAQENDKCEHLHEASEAEKRLAKVEEQRRRNEARRKREARELEADVLRAKVLEDREKEEKRKEKEREDKARVIASQHRQLAEAVVLLFVICFAFVIMVFHAVDIARGRGRPRLFACVNMHGHN